jgi:hypothetical protein
LGTYYTSTGYRTRVEHKYVRLEIANGIQLTSWQYLATGPREPRELQPVIERR